MATADKVQVWHESKLRLAVRVGLIDALELASERQVDSAALSTLTGKELSHSGPEALHGAETFLDEGRWSLHFLHWVSEVTSMATPLF